MLKHRILDEGSYLGSSGRSWLGYFALLQIGLFTLAAGYHFFVGYSAHKQKTITLEGKLLTFQENYESILLSVETLSNYIHGELLALPGLSEAVARLESATTDEAAEVERAALYQIVLPLYQRAVDANLKQLHFHSKESRSLLRMHRPEKFGDSLKGVRHTIDLANAEQRAVSAFEEGRIFNGYRFVYPLYHEGAHIGTVEVSFSSSALLEKLFEIHQNAQFGFLISKQVVKDVVFNDEQAQYQTSVFSEDYTEENNQFSTSFITRSNGFWDDDNALKLLTDSFSRATSKANEDGVVSFKYNGMHYKLASIPVKDILGHAVANVVAVEPSESLGLIAKRAKQSHLAGLGIGAILMLGGTFLYFNWQKKTQEAMRVNRRLQLIASEIPGVIYQFRYWPETGRASFPYASKGIKEVYGVTPEQVFEDASLAFTVIHPDDAAMVNASIEESARTMERWFCEYRVCFKDERVEWMQGNAMPQPMPDGSILWHGYINNITQQKEYERMLRDARIQAESAEEAKSRFLATMSHEIRTPMNAIIGLSDLLQSTELNAEQAEFVTTIIDSGNTLLELISDILDYSKIDAERLVLIESKFQLSEMIRKISGISQSLAKAKWVRFRVHESGKLPEHLIGDADRITQVILNLISNAVKFSDKGKQVDFYIHTSPFENDRVMLEFEVVDHGIGIPKEDQKKIFEPFSQSAASMAGHYQGTGLGLSISARLSELMGGTLSCKSTVGSGSSFSFKVPLIEVEDEKTALEQKSGAASLGSSSEGFSESNISILLVDDNPLNLKIANTMLGRMGLTADSAENGQEALSACLAKAYDLVLMDLRMPVMDGNKAAASIFSQVAPEQCPSIVALTADVSEAKRKQCLSLGMDDYLTKPVKMQRLREVIETTIKNKKS